MRDNPFSVLPETVDIDGVSYPINADFRAGVQVEREALSKDKPDVAGLLTLFYGQSVPQNIEEAVERMLWFYQAPTQEEGGEKSEKKGGRWYDFEQDADVLLASFLSAYNVDLSTAKLHWWTFRRLMLNLPAETPFMKRVHYRVTDIKKLSKDQKKHYKKMKELYKIRDERPPKYASVEERDAAILEMVNRRFEEAQKVVRTDGG